MLPKNETQKWMRDSLQNGPSLTLSRIIDNFWEWDKTRFFTFAYDDLNESSLLNFKFGGIVDNADEFIMNYAKRKYDNRKMQFLVEDWSINSDSIHLINVNIPYIIKDNEVYNFIEINNNLCIEKFTTAFYNLPAALHAYVLPQYSDFSLGMHITEERLLEISKDVKEIICGAYDGEGYVVASIED